ncbi:MAG TPA: tetratricopeptide repeat protein [Thermoanaerobaculia bacterium]|nr:tetratricopeptide repeat protein [Thermoanaerobaculia bacterium]
MLIEPIRPSLGAESRWHRLEALFAGASELPAAEREAFLDTACGSEPDLRTEVEAMLASAGEACALAIETWLLTGVTSPPAPAPERAGVYRLVSLLAQGGMGEVWRGKREGGEFEQEVAVKLLRPGLSRPDLAARFRTERQILARLSHPLIVPLLDGGVTDDGRPYLVMPHVPGLPITEHCQRHELPAAQRLRLLAAVCRAVQHAHANLIVHRDLKPSNILVTPEGEPRLLDFGIAKLLAPEGEEVPGATAPRMVWGTPERTAPEQLFGEPITTATDVYGLGVLLVELLTGRLPRPPGGANDDSAPAPEHGPALPADLGLSGDLERIAAKALDPDPARRYASAGQLGEDLERYLAGQPVLAAPDRWAYRARKFVRRHLAATLAAAVAAGAVLAFGVTSTLQTRRIAAERDRATAEEARARKAVDLLVGLFREADPRTGPGGDTLDVGELLARARERVAQLADQPALQARLEQVLGEIHRSRSRYAEAVELFRHARDLQIGLAGPDDPFALELASEHAWALFFTSERRLSERLLRELLERQRRVLGAEHLEVSETLQRLSAIAGGEEGARLAHEALAMEQRRRPTDRLSLASAWAGVGGAGLRSGDLASAATAYRQAAEIYRVEYGEDHPATITALSNLATSLTDLAEQEALYRRLIEVSRRKLGPLSAPVGDRLSYLGLNLSKQGRFAEAEALLEEGLAVWRQVGGPDHERVATTEVYLARLLDRRDRRDEALAATHHARAVARSPEVADPWLLAIASTQHARTLLHAGRPAEALVAARESLAALGADTSRAAVRADALLVLGLALLESATPAEALPHLEQALALRLAITPAQDPRVGEVRCALGRTLTALGRGAEAADARRSGLASFEGWSMAHPRDVTACRGAGTPP